jgi:hypothetical protein
MLRRIFGPAAAAVALALVLAPGAGATELGHAQSLSTSGGENCGTDLTWVQTAASSANYTAPFDGVITSWSAGAHISTAIKLKLLRPSGSDTYSVIASDGPRNPGSDISTYPVRFPVRQGDSIAMHVGTFHACFAGYGAVAGDVAKPVSGDPAVGEGIEVSGTSYATTRLPISATLEPDSDGDGYGDETQDKCPTLASTHGACPLPTRLGETFTPSITSGNGCDGDTQIPLTRSGPEAGVVYVAPQDGVITSWAFQGGSRATGTVTLKMFRPVGGTSYRTVGEDGPHPAVANTLSTYPARVPVEQDDRIGLSVTGVVDCGHGNDSGSQLFFNGNPPVGATNDFFETSYSTSVSALLEADADHDGFGDTTQDKCPTDPATQGTCPVKPPPPTESKACKAARAKLTKAKAKLSKLKKNDAPAKKVKKAKKAVKKAKAKVKKAC